MLRFKDVGFAYRRRPALFSHLNWEAGPGVSLILGPNGAGKSTLLSLAATLLSVDSGRVLLGELDSSRRADRIEWRKAIGWVPQTITTVPGFTALEQVAYTAWNHGLPRSQAKAAALKALEAVNLAEHSSETCTRLSGGQLRRVGIACALSHSPEVLLMDEPTAGLDPTQRKLFRELVRELSPNVAMILSTHQTEDLPALADHIAVMLHGSILWDGSAADFLALAPEKTATYEAAELAYSRVVGHHAQ